MQLLDQPFSLEGKVALVTGGYGSIGAAACQSLAGVGAQVTVVGRDRDKALAEDVGGIYVMSRRCANKSITASPRVSRLSQSFMLCSNTSPFWMRRLPTWSVKSMIIWITTLT